MENTKQGTGIKSGRTGGVNEGAMYLGKVVREGF